VNVTLARKDIGRSRNCAGVSIRNIFVVGRRIVQYYLIKQLLDEMYSRSHGRE
jgi:hypothetical protein